MTTADRKATVPATVTSVEPLRIATDGSETDCAAIAYANAGSFWVGRRVKVQCENPLTPIIEGGL